MYCHFTYASNDMLAHHLMNMKTYELSYSMIDVKVHH